MDDLKYYAAETAMLVGAVVFGAIFLIGVIVVHRRHSR